jgi:hypothetical protein
MRALKSWGTGWIGFRGCRDHRDIGAHGRSELDAHVPEAAQPGDSYLGARPDAEFAKRRIRGDSGAEQRRSAADVQARGKAADELLPNDDMVAVTTVGDGPVLQILAAIGHDPVRAELLVSRHAVLAGEVAVDKTSDGSAVSDLELGHRGAGAGHHADDLMTGDHRIDAHAPIVVRHMQVGMANSAVSDLDRDVFGPKPASLDRHRFDWRLGVRDSICLRLSGPGGGLCGRRLHRRRHKNLLSCSFQYAPGLH